MSTNPEEYLSVYQAYGLLNAESIRAFLESFGITAQIRQEGAGAAIGLTVGPLGVAEVFVAAADAPRATELLSELEQGKYALSDDQAELPDLSADADL